MTHSPTDTESDEARLKQLLDDFQAGDQEAGQELWSRYKDEILRSVRARMRDPSLRQFVASMDITDSVARRICGRIDQYEFETFQDFRNLVAVIVRRRVAEAHRELRRRAERNAVSLGDVEFDPADPLEGAADEGLVAKEMWEACRQLFTDEEWLLFELVRIEGHSWKEVSERFGEKPDTLRKRLERSITRVRQELGLEDF